MSVSAPPFVVSERPNRRVAVVADHNLEFLSFQVPTERTVSPRLSLFPVLCHHTRPAFCYRRTRDRREGGRERGPKGNFSCFVVVLCRAQPPLPRWAIRLVGGIGRSNGVRTPEKGFEMESRGHGTSLEDHRSLPRTSVQRWALLVSFLAFRGRRSLETDGLVWIRRILLLPPTVRPTRERERERNGRHT